MADFPTQEAERQLNDTQESLDRMLRHEFDMDTRRLLRQVQVHVHEALQILREEARWE